MKKSNRNIILAVVGLLAIAGLGGWFYVQSILSFPSLPSYDSSIILARPVGTMCINKESPRLALELIDLGQKVVFVSGGSNPISESKWDQTKVNFPQQKNSKRHLLFSDTCLLRSFNASPDCAGEACKTFATFYGHSWFALNAISGQGCFPDKSGCNGSEVKAGYVSITTIDKCQELTFQDSINELSEDKGNRFVMHATATGTPQLEGINLPQGWKLKKKTLSTPLTLKPRGLGHCYFNILRDEKVQSYHQYVFAEANYPPAYLQKP